VWRRSVWASMMRIRAISSQHLLRHGVPRLDRWCRLFVLPNGTGNDANAGSVLCAVRQSRSGCPHRLRPRSHPCARERGRFDRGSPNIDAASLARTSASTRPEPVVSL
jgi:hypothetical protein